MSTTVEHKEYVNFLQDLKGFFSAKFVIRFFIFFAVILPSFLQLYEGFYSKISSLLFGLSVFCNLCS